MKIEQSIYLYGRWIPDLPVRIHRFVVKMSLLALAFSPTSGCSVPPQIAGNGVDNSAAPDVWNHFQGAWFTIGYPSNFHPRPSLAAGKEGSFDSAFFIAEGDDASFYVLSPQWRRSADDIALRSDQEIRLEQTERVQEGFLKRSTLIGARDGSYERLIESYVSPDQTVSWTFQFRYAGDREKIRYLPLYKRFKASLKQFTD